VIFLNDARVIALGFFDGIHIGHAALLRRTRERADELDCRACALTFDRHPDAVIFGTDVPLIASLPDRELLMKERFGMDEVLLAHFDHAMMTMPWETFISDELRNRLRARHVVCGHDFRFGYRGEGTPERLAGACRRLGMGCDIIPKVTLDGETVSSTRIREQLTAGEFDEALRFLGHPPVYSGVVAHGNRIGTTLAVPTANLPFPDGVLVPARGVYCARVALEGRDYPAVANIGVHPTAGASERPVLEAWIFDFSGDLYGKQISVWLCGFLRPERTFPSMQALRAQILLDAAEAKARLSRPE